MKELWEEAISLLPPTKELDTFFLAYRPWIKDKSHTYYILMREVYLYRGLQAFGNTPEEALQDFIIKMKKWE